MVIRLWVCLETVRPPGGKEMIVSIPGGIDFFMKKKQIIALVSLIVISFVILSLSPSYIDRYIFSIYPNSEITKTRFDKNLNSENCFVECVYAVDFDHKELTCYFIKSMGYKDYLYYMVEINNKNESIEQVRLIEEHETEDYGGYIREGWFLERFKNISLHHTIDLVKVFPKTDYEIVAITGATITSLSASQAVNMAIEIHNNTN